MIFRTAFFALPLALAALSTAAAFSVQTRGLAKSSTALFDGNGTGGWGIGGSRELTPEEFARGERSAFDGYKMTEAGDFLQQIRDEQQQLKKSERSELLAVAKMAGIDMKDPKDKLNKFDPFLLDEDELDLSI